MSLWGMIEMSSLHRWRCHQLTSGFKNLINPVNSVQPVPLRSYMKNFQNENNNIKPVLGWMHQNRVRQAYGSNAKNRQSLKTYSEVKRWSYGYESRMKTEGGRKIIMRRILRGKDHLS